MIVIEGIDGCGKTTLCASLVERLGPGASLHRTPSSRMSRLRQVFDACDENVRRAYYSLCNYSVARDLLKSAAVGPVVLDRYWHSTVAYALAHTQRGALASPNIIVEWPHDLLRPSAVLLLTVGEEERQRRMSVRGVHTTQEESEIKNKAGMRRQLMEAYRELKPTAEIDGNGTASEVLEAVWLELRKRRVVEPQTDSMSSIIPISVNYHLTRKCNYHCKFCFHTAKSSSYLPLYEAKRGLRELQEHGMKKINFSGGEPFIIENGDFLGELCIYCKKYLKVESVSVICNGSLVTEQWFDKYAHYIDVFGLSIDSFKENTLVDIGRYGAEGVEGHIDKVYAIRSWCAKYGVKFKINTVVTKQILVEDMAPHMRELRPDRWKVFQCLLIDGENVGEKAIRDASSCVVTAVEFQDWVYRHAELSPIVESNELMMNSYLILDEKMRFLNCTKGRKDSSVSILDDGVLKALVEAGHDQQAFYRRGGSYEWSKTLSSSVHEQS